MKQGRDYRVRPDSAGAGSYPRSAAHRIAPLCNGLPHRDIQRRSAPSVSLRPILLKNVIGLP